MTTPLASAKAALRKQVRAQVQSLTEAERAARSAQISSRLAASERWSGSKSVLLYAPLPDEPDIWQLLADALAEGRRAALPCFEPDQNGYSARLIRDLAADTRSGKFGIREPRPHCAAIPLEQLDLVLVPGVAFDLGGRRLGRGRGYYDRLLAKVHGTKCGVAFDQQLVTNLPAEEHDAPLDCIVTPTRWIDVNA